MLKRLSLLFTLLTSVSCKTIIIGDSMFAESPIPSNLEKSLNIKIDNRALVGASLQKGWVKSIPEQYEDIRNLNPDTIIMDGGGNDVMSNYYSCLQFNNNCKNMIDNVTLIAKDLMEKMRGNCVKNIVYMGFFYVKGLNRAIDYGTEKLMEVCHNIAKTNGSTGSSTGGNNLRRTESLFNEEGGCYFCDPRNLTIPVGWDGLHPTNEGYKMLSDAIYNTILNNNIQVV